MANTINVSTTSKSITVTPQNTNVSIGTSNHPITVTQNPSTTVTITTQGSGGNISPTTGNTVTITPQNNSINVGTNNNPVTISQESTSVVSVVSLGPQGNVGPQGNKGDPGELTYFSDLTITGSLFVSGTLGTPSNITLSGDISSSILSTSSFGTYLGDGSQLTGVISSIRGDDVLFTDISASGNISASGDIAGGGLNINGPSNSHVEVGTYNVGYDQINFPTAQITGSGLIISGAMLGDHHNMLKIGNVELIDAILPNALTKNQFLIHNVESFKITSGSDGGNITTANILLEHDGGSFKVFGGVGSTPLLEINTTTAKFQTTATEFISDDIKIKASAPIDAPSEGTIFLSATNYSPSSAPVPSLGAIETNKLFPYLSGNITASAVSASGTITSDGIYLGGILRTTWPASSEGEWALVGSAQTSSLDVIVEGFISASGNISASNLSGTNTGDQDLSSFVVNSQTGSFVVNSQTGSFVVNSQTGSFAITGSDVLFANITSSGNISASGDISASGLLIEKSGSAILTLNHTQNGQDSRINLLEDGDQFGAYLEYDSEDFHIGSINGGVDTNSMNILRAGDLKFNKDVSILGNSKLIIHLDNDTTNPAFQVKDENSGGDIFTIRGTGQEDDAILFLSGSTSLSGSTNQTGDLNINGNITSSGNISASTTSTASFGLYLGDGSQLTGVASTVDSSSFAITGSDVLFANITASGNISASGTITGDIFTIGDKIYAKYHAGTNSLRMGTSAVGMTFMSQEFIKYSTDITSSGNVSSSTTSTASFGLYLGDGSQLTGVTSTVDSSSFAITGSDVIFANLTSSGNISASISSTASFGLYLGDGSQLTGVASTVDSSSFAITGSDVLFTDISASGNISASGKIQADNFYVGRSPAIDYSSDTVRFGFANNTPISIGKQSNPITINGHLTASGNISASGHITTQDLTTEELTVNGTGIPTIISPTNILLSASNAVVIQSSPLRLKGYTNAETGSAVGSAGDIYFNSDTSQFMGWNGTNHVVLG